MATSNLNPFLLPIKVDEYQSHCSTVAFCGGVISQTSLESARTLKQAIIDIVSNNTRAP